MPLWRTKAVTPPVLEPGSIRFVAQVEPRSLRLLRVRSPLLSRGFCGAG